MGIAELALSAVEGLHPSYVGIGDFVAWVEAPCADTHRRHHRYWDGIIGPRPVNYSTANLKEILQIEAIGSCRPSLDTDVIAAAQAIKSLDNRAGRIESD